MKSWKVTLPNMLMLVFVVCVLLSNLIPVPGIVGSAMISFCGCVCYLYVFIKKRGDAKLWKVIGLTVFLSLCMVVSSLYNHNASLKEVLWIWCYIGAALLLCYFEIDDRWMQLVFYLLCGYYGICIVMQRSIHYILYSTSRNGISIQILFVMLLIYLCRGTKKRVIYLPAVFSVIISVWSLGRAGVLVAVFFLGGIVIYGLVKEGWKKTWKRLLGMAATLAVFMLLLITVFPTNETLRPEDKKADQTESLDDKTDQMSPIQGTQNIQNEEDDKKVESTFVSRFASYGFKSIRMSIWAEYLVGTVSSVPDFLLGLDCSRGELLSYYRQPHNSYLELHAKFGLAGFAAVMTMLFIVFVRLCRDREGFLLFILATCAFRALLDWTAFPGSLDMFFWFLCFYKVFHIEIVMYEERILSTEVSG